MKFVVAIDGPAAAGKGTIAKAVANHFGFPHLDSGLLYRAVAAKTLRGSAPEQAAATLHIEDLNALNFDPSISPMVDGAYGMSSTITQEVINPLAGVANSYSKTKTDKLIGKIELQYDLLDNLKITSRFG